MPMQQAEECAVRRIDNDESASALDMDVDVLEKWWRRPASKPTLTNAQAMEPESDKES